MVSRKLLPQLLLVLIVILALLLRVYKLDNFPPGFYADEASIGFNAYKIITTLHDEHGKFLPLFFEAFGEYKNALAIYPVAIAFSIFGMSEFATRLPQAILGAVIVFSMFFLAKELFNEKVGLISAFVIAAIPWHVHLSRFNIESHNFYLLLIILGTTFLLISYRNKWESKFLSLSVVSFAFSFYTYFATRIFTPLYLIGLIFIFRNDLIKLIRFKRWLFTYSVIIFIVITLPFALHMISGKGFARYKQVPIYNEFNKPDQLIKNRLNLYFNHLTLDFVFIKGDSDYPKQLMNRLSVNGIGLFYKWQLIFWFIGVVSLIIIKSNEFPSNKKLIIFLMLLLYPLASVFSDAKTPYATRSIIGIIPYTLITSYGLYMSLLFLKKLNIVKLRYFFMTLFIFAVVVINLFYMNRFLNLYQAYINRAYGYIGFQYGAKQIVNYFLENNDKFQLKIIYSGFDGTDALLNFYGLGNCKNCYKFDPKPCESDISKLIAVSVDNKSGFDKLYEATLKEVIFYPNGIKAFEIFEAFSKKCS